MRVISGIHRGRTIRAPKNLPVRPTTDRAKEGLFNILANQMDLNGAKVLDLFCGTGNISYELLSRGAADITCVDSHPKCAAFVKETLALLGSTSSHVVKTDALSFIGRSTTSWDLIFADPPYDYPNHAGLVKCIFENHALTNNGLLVLEHPGIIDLSKNELYLNTRNYGRVHFSFFGSEM